MGRMTFRSPALAAIAALFLGGAAPAEKEPDLDPPVWLVRDRDTTIYLFGTIHLLDARSEWFNDEVKTAFDASDTVILEAVLPENPAQMQQLIAKYALQDRGRRLSDQVPPKLKPILDKQLAEAGITAATADTLDPWYVASALTVLRAQKLGFTSTAAPEATLTLAARRTGKQLEELESGDIQFALLNALPEEQQLALLAGTLDDNARLGSLLGAMIKAWGEGNSDALARIMNAEMPVALQKALLTDRNAKWAERIVARLQRPGTVFIAVGAGHLAGKDSLREILIRRGVKVLRFTN